MTKESHTCSVLSLPPNCQPLSCKYCSSLREMSYNLAALDAENLRKPDETVQVNKVNKLTTQEALPQSTYLPASAPHIDALRPVQNQGHHRSMCESRYARCSCSGSLYCNLIASWVSETIQMQKTNTYLGILDGSTMLDERRRQ